MKDTPREIRRIAEQRIEEIRREYDRLSAIVALVDRGGPVSQGELERLLAGAGLDPSLSAPRPVIRVASRGTEPGRDGRAPQGSNKQKIVDLVVAHPGITTTEIAERTGIKRETVKSTVTRMRRKGELQRCGDGVRIPLAPLGHGAAR